MKEFIKRLFAKKATIEELEEKNRILTEAFRRSIRDTGKIYDENFHRMNRYLYEQEKQVTRIERRLGDSFQLVEGKNEMKDEANDLESELYGRDASESKEQHDKLVRLSVLRAKLRDKNIPSKTHFKVIRVEEMALPKE